MSTTKKVVKTTATPAQKKTTITPKQKSTKVLKQIKNEDSEDDEENVVEIIEEEPVKEVAKNNQTGLKDLKKINDDPEEYARSVTVERLVTILQKLSDFYYGESRSLVDDDVYDVMVDVLTERDPNNAFLFQTGVTKTTDKDIDLPFPMPSLNKMKPGEKPLARFFKTYPGPYIFMDKLDGVSLQDYKDSKGNDDLFTKKQTGMGTSKKHLMKYLVSKKTQDNVPNDTSIRGELVIAKTDFVEVSKFDPDLKNERSAMTGLVNTDKIDVRIAKKAQFVTYGILNSNEKISDQLESLEEMGFKTVWYKEYTLEELKEHDDVDPEDDPTGIKAIEANLKDILTDRQASSEFLADGIVCTDNSKGYQHKADNPKHSLAFKMNSTVGMKNVLVEEVIWEPTMYSYLQPVVITKPVILSGNTTCQRFTAHNAKYVHDNKIGKGATIKVVRSGDVIPYIVSVVKPAKKADMPKDKYEWNATQVDIIVVDPSEEINRLIQIKRNLHLFRKLRVKFLSEETMAKLYDAGYDTMASIVEAATNRDTAPYKIDRLGEKTMTKIYDQIDKAFNQVKLPDLMSGSLIFGQGLGAKKIKEILKMYPEILKMKDDDVEDIEDKILKVPGFSHNLAGKFAKNLKEFGEFVEELKNVSEYDLSFKVPEKVVVPKGKKGTKKIVKDDLSEEENNGKNDGGEFDLSKEIILITGFRSEPMVEFIDNNGGKTGSSISGKTTLVVYADPQKSFGKIQKAKDLGIKLMTRDEFKTKYGVY